MNHRWYSPKELLEHLQISRSTLDLWLADGRGPRYVKLPNGRLRFRDDWLEEWLEELPAA